MAQYFFDTSALIKLYHEEDGSEQVKRIFGSLDWVARISSLDLVEIHSALAVRFGRDISPREAARGLTARVPADLLSGHIKRRMVILQRRNGSSGSS